MEAFLLVLIKALCGLTLIIGNLCGAYQSDQSGFPVVTDCHEKDIDLILVSDAASEDYVIHLHLLSQVVDMLSFGEENLKYLRVAMAVSGSDGEGRANVSWLFHLGTFSKTSEIKRAIMSDRDRHRSNFSYLREAVEFVGGNVNGTGTLVKERLSTETPFTLVNVAQRNTTSSENGSVDGRENNDNFSLADGIISMHPTSGQVMLILALANFFLESHRENEPDPDSFHSNKKLLIVFLVPSTRSSREDLPCHRLVRNACIDLSSKTALEDHSLSIALCGRCNHQWFGPMPGFKMSAEETIKTRNYPPAFTFTSCYRLLADKTNKTFAMNALESCTTIGSSLVSIESELELNYLSKELKERCGTGNECPIESKSLVYIGLMRNTNSLGKRFLWINDRPVIYSQWSGGMPVGGMMQGCAVWNYYMDQWMDVGCGQVLSATALCEWTKMVNPEMLVIPVPPSPDMDSIQRAVNRGEIGVCRPFYANMDTMPVLMAAHLVHTSGCYLQVNNTGRVQTVDIPLSAERVFSCENEYNGPILFSRVCDQSKDCANGRDENLDLCQIPSDHEVGGFTCVTSKRIVPAGARCDLHVDCTDKSDEENCDTCQFGLCSDGRCLPQPWLSDGQKDCMSLSAPLDLDISISINAVDDCAFLCNRSKCVPWSKLGDGVVDCLGPEGPLDETLGALERVDCKSGASMEWAPRCIYHKDRLGELIGCRNMRHLHGCEDFVCPDGYIKCPRAYCIPAHYLYNGKIDCPMGADEPVPNMRHEHLPGYFKCDYYIGSVVLHPDRVCDGSQDCANGFDELGCQVTCASGFLCVGGFVVPDDLDRSEPLANLSFLDPRTRMIDFSHFNASAILPAISQLDLSYLLDLRLSDCSIRNLLVPNIKFHRLSMLDLSYNLIRNITHEGSKLKAIFFEITSLRLLNLSHNAYLELFDTDTLKSNPNLRILDLSHTALVAFPKMASVTYTLTHLNLSHTHIKRLASFTFPSGPKSWYLEILDLQNVDIEEVEPDTFSGLRVVSHLHSNYFKICCPQIRGSGIPAHTCHAPVDPLSSCFNLLENKLLRILVWVMGVASLLGNLIVIATRLAGGRKNLRLPYAQCVIQLGMSDFLMGIYLIIIGSRDVRFQGEYARHDTAWLKSDLCRAAGFLSTVSNEVSSFFILFITIDRYLVIKFPFGQHRLSSAGVFILSFLAWGVGLILATVPLLPWTENWNLYSSNAVCLGLPLLPEKRAGWQFSTAVFLVLNFLLCLCIASGQLAIYIAASAHRRSAAASVTYGNTSSWSGDISPRMKQDMVLARRLATVAFTDLLCWVPIGVLGLLSLGGHNLGSEAYAWMAVFVMPVNSALNPMLYSLPVLKDRLARAMNQFVKSTKRHRRKSDHKSTSSRH